jgi:epoxyqueuosine reductase
MPGPADPVTLSARLKEIALEAGFDGCGIAAAQALEEEREHLREWLRQGMHAGMAWMEGNFDKRLDPTALMPGTRSVICLIHNYYPEKESSGEYRIARYALGEDYHFVLKDKMRPILDWLSDQGATASRAFTDSAPILERAWAQRAGLGWTGKNSLLLNREMGSYFFLAEILTDLGLAPDAPITRDYCGGCVRCITACPTQAIVQPGVVDARRCISYLTIENKYDIPEEFRGQYQDWIFGCDICQEVCPWNSKASPNQEPRLKAHPDLLNLRKSDLDTLTEAEFTRRFARSPLARTGYSGLKRNAEFLYTE